MLKDKDIHSDGSQTTDVDREVWLAEAPNTHRMLIRREIENYLYDIEILRKYKNDISSEDYRKLVTDVKEDNIKDIEPSIKDLCGATQLPAEEFKLKLASLITPETAVYSELRKVLFE